METTVKKRKPNSIEEWYQSRNIWGFLLGCLLGILCFLLIYGYRIIDVTNIDWLLHSEDLEGSIDLTQHYLGWVFYRNSAWSFPLGLTEGLYWDKISVVYTDSIPLFAIFFKCLSPLLPENFQYFGIYGLLCYCLMGGFGALITEKFLKSPLVQACSALLFVMSPVMLNRMYLHTALAAHFLLVAGLCLWLYRDMFSRRKYIFLWSLLAVTATLLNAYFTPMVLGIFFCSVLQEWIAGGKLRKLLSEVVIPCVLLLLVGYVVGMFYGDIKADGGGLDILSFNLNGFWNPGTYLSHYGKRTFDSSEFVLMNYSNLLPALGLFREYQNEGFAYLGVGVLLLLLITGIGILGKIVLAGKTKRLGLDRKSGSYLAALIIYVVVFVYLALSPRWTWGTGELFYISYPQKIFQLLSIFRSTGRFIWPVYYLLIALGCIGIIKVLQNRSVLLKLILVVLVLVQLYDLLPGFEEKREAFSKDTPYTTVLQSEVWQYLGENGEEIIFYPPTLQGLYYDCKTSMEFEIYALQYGLSLNMTYMSRDLTEVADRRTLEHFSERAQGLRDDKAIYIFFDCVRDELPSEEETGLHYYEIDGYIVGTELDLSQFSLQKLE